MTDFNSVLICLGMEYDYSLKNKSYGTKCKKRQKIRERTFSDGGENKDPRKTIKVQQPNRQRLSECKSAFEE